MGTKSWPVITRGLVLAVAASMLGGVGALRSAQSASGPVASPEAGTVELLIDGRPAPDALAWEDLAAASVALRVPGSGGGDDPRSATVTCADRASGETGRVTVPFWGILGDADRIDLAAAVPGLPYPIDPLGIESKPAAIISQQARRSVVLLSPDELRRRFRDTSAYMLTTADHHYRLPTGDGVLDCRIGVGVGDTGSASAQDGGPGTFSIVFGRGLPVGPYARALGSPPLAAWPRWVVDAGQLPGDLEAVVLQALTGELEGPPTDDPATLAARRSADDGAAPGPWIEAALGIIASRGVNPPRAARALALVSVAMSDALRIRRELDERVAGGQTRSVAPGEHAVVASAAATVLRGLFPDDTAILEPLESAVDAWSSGDPATDDAFRRLGSWVGELVLARGAGDGSDAKWTGTVPDAPWAWHSVAPNSKGPVEPLAGTWRTWNLASGSDLRPPAPPRPGDAAFERDLEEVWSVRSALDLAGQQIASYWEDKYGSLTPPGHWTAIALRMVRAQGWSTDDVALLFALLSTAQADSFIAAWDAKYAYWSMRPVAAVREFIDPTWAPYVSTPDFPSYVSGHATTSGAAATILAALVPERSQELQACAAQAAESRLLGGIHFRTDNAVGLRLGDEVAREALARVDLPAIRETLPSGAAPLGCLWDIGGA